MRPLPRGVDGLLPVAPLELEMQLHGIRFEATPTNIRPHLGAVLSLVQRGRVAPEEITTETLRWDDLPGALAEPSMKPVFVRSPT
jgi:hypothetical protein